MEINLNSFELPIYCQTDEEYYSKLSVVLKEYLAYMKSAVRENSIIEELETNIDLILKSIVLYYNANFQLAKENIMSILQKHKDNEFIVSDLNNSYAFRGMAPFKNLRESWVSGNRYDYMQKCPLSFFKARESDCSLGFKDMLHIPLNLRGKVSTNRFSMAGIPCIYLATTSYCCWIELNMPSNYNFYVSALEVPLDLKVLNLCISQGVINGGAYCENEEQLNLLRQMIVIWPLVCASSFTISERNRFFKSEYIVSQLIMQCAKELKIDAIAYLSKKISDYNSYPQCVNLAIPVGKDGSLNNLYWQHALKTKITNPILFSDYIKKKLLYNGKNQSYINLVHQSDDDFGLENYNDIIDILEQDMHYSSSKFSKFDDYLVNQEYYSFQID